MKKRLFSILMALSLLMTMVVGCAAPAEEETPPADASQETEEAPADEESGEDVVVEIITWAGLSDAESSFLIDEYEAANPGVTIAYQFVPEDYLTKLNTVIAAGEAPDIAAVYEDMVVDWGNQGLATDISDLVTEAGIDINGFLNEGVVFGNGDAIYGIGTGPEVILLFYSPELFDAAGVEYPSTDAHNPWTWEEYTEAAIKLTKDANGLTPNDAGFDKNSIVTYGTLAPTFWNYLQPILHSNGGGYMADDGMSLKIDEPESIEVLQGVSDLINVHNVAPNPFVQASLPSSGQMLIDGQTAMFISGQWEVGVYGLSDFRDYGVAPIPMFSEPANIIWTAAEVIMADSDVKTAAAEYLSYKILGSNATSSASGMSIANTREMYEDPDLLAQWTGGGIHTPDYVDVVPEIALNIAKAPESIYVKDFATIVTQGVVPELDAIWSGDKTAEEAVAGLEEKFADKFQGVH